MAQSGNFHKLGPVQMGSVHLSLGASIGDFEIPIFIECIWLQLWSHLRIQCEGLRVGGAQHFGSTVLNPDLPSKHCGPWNDNLSKAWVLGIFLIHFLFLLRGRTFLWLSDIVSLKKWHLVMAEYITMCRLSDILLSSCLLCFVQLFSFSF